MARSSDDILPVWYAVSMNARSVLGCVALSLLACAAGDDTMISASTSPLGDTTDATTMPGSESGSTQSTTMPDSSGTAEESSTSSMPGNTVLFETTLGDIVIELDPELAPITVENFFAYVDAGFYDGSDGMGATTFHRVVAGFVIQGGGVTEAGGLKPTMSPIVNEFGNGLTNLRGTISMARTSDPDSATSQFFINLVDNPDLDIPPGYAVFGQVVEGLDVVDAIGATPTMNEVPDEPIVIMAATRL
jgi:peptidyl-prolyl cis-trans isomerase A (cyclophilin A)